MSVASIRTVVVLPAPFAPNNPHTDPVGIDKEMSETALTVPNFLPSDSASIAIAGNITIECPPSSSDYSAGLQ